MLKKPFAVLALALALGPVAHAAADAEAKIIKVSSYEDNRWYVVLDRPVKCNAPYPNQAATSTAFLFTSRPDFQYGNAMSLATAAMLSGRAIEIAGNGITPNGFCTAVLITLK